MINLKQFLKRFLSSRIEKLKNGPHSKLFIILQFVQSRMRAAFVLRESNIHNVAKSYSLKRGEPWVILEYKRITEPANTIVPIAEHHYVTPATFRMHCKMLARHAHVISLPVLIDKILTKQEITPGTVAITISGGHLDAYLAGLPPLLEYNLPAAWCIPTAVIGSKTLLLDDLIAVSMKLFSHHKVPIGSFEALHEGMLKSLSQTLENGIPTPKSIASFLALFFSLPPDKQILLLRELKEKLLSLPTGPPEFEDFMSWNDIEELNKRGFPILSMFHSHPIMMKLSTEALDEEITNARRALDSLDIPWHNIAAAPYGLYSTSNCESLFNLGLRALLAAEHPEPVFNQPLDSQVPVFARISMCEGNSFSRELFLARLWELT